MLEAELMHLKHMSKSYFGPTACFIIYLMAYMTKSYI